MKVLFLVQLETRLPSELSAEDRATLLAREAACGAELVEAGTITGIWRLPGRLANVGIWSAADADSLHDALTSLPAWQWMTVTVTALAGHPLMETRD